MKLAVGIISLFALGLCQNVHASENFVGVITNQAKEFGANRCIKEINLIDKFLNEEAGPNGAWSSAAKVKPSDRIYTALNIKKYDDGTWGYATMSVAPGVDNSCDGTLMQLVTFPNKSCNTVRETTFKEYRYKGELAAGKAVYEKGHIGLVLEDLTGSCVALRHETLYPVQQ